MVAAMRLTLIGPAALTLLSLVHTWLTGSAQRPVAQRCGWLLGAALLAPCSALYNAATAQWPFVLAQLVFGAAALRGYRRAAQRLPAAPAAPEPLHDGCCALCGEVVQRSTRRAAQRAGAA